MKLRCFLMIAAGLVLSGCAKAAPFEEDDLLMALMETRASARFSEWLPESDIQAVLQTEPLCRTGLSAVTQHREPAGTVRAEFARVADVNIDKLLRLVRESSGRVRLNPAQPNVLFLQTGKIGLKEKSEFIRENLERFAELYEQ